MILWKRNIYQYMWKCLKVGSHLSIKLLGIMLYTPSKNMLVRYHMKLRSVCFFLRFLWLKNRKVLGGFSLLVFWFSYIALHSAASIRQRRMGYNGCPSYQFFLQENGLRILKREREKWQLRCFKPFYFDPPTWGNDPIWRAYFSNGLKPPTRQNYFKRFLAFLWHDVSCPENFGTIHHMIRVILHRTFPIICK